MFAICESGLAGDRYDNDLVRSYGILITRSAEDGIGIAKLEGNQAMLLVIILAFVALIHTLHHM